jgi:chromate reductase, NAD(P)H dehydrogenase (quinone)
MPKNVQILLVSGSLRRRSTSLAVLRTGQAVAREGIVASLFEGLGDLPHFNPDLDAEPLPPAVSDLRAQIRAVDALMFSTPEYAGALPGTFKNLLDWTVGDEHPGSVYEKPVAWMNASPRGAHNAHESLGKVLGYVHALVVEAACVHVPVTEAQIDGDGTISDRIVRERIAAALSELAGAVID